MTELVAQEMEILQKLIKYINENSVELAEISKLCAKLDCLISFAKVAEKYQYVRPNITKDKRIEIINGRHLCLNKLNNTFPVQH